MITVKVEGLGPLLKTLQSLPKEIVSKNGGPVRSSLRAAAVVVQKEAQANIDRIAVEGESNESTGTLKKALIVSRRKPGNFKGERYWLRVKRGAKSPDGVTANTYGGVLEFGDARVPAKAWMRKAWEAKQAEALSTFTSDLQKRLNRITKKLLRKRVK